MFKTWKTLTLSALLGVAAIAVAACGGQAEPEVITEVQTVIVEKQVPGEAVVQTVIVEKQVPGQTVLQTVVVEKQVPGQTGGADRGRRERGPRPDSGANSCSREDRDSGPGAGCPSSQRAPL